MKFDVLVEQNSVVVVKTTARERQKSVLQVQIYFAN